MTIENWIAIIGGSGGGLAVAMAIYHTINAQRRERNTDERTEQTIAKLNARLDAQQKFQTDYLIAIATKNGEIIARNTEVISQCLEALRKP